MRNRWDELRKRLERFLGPKRGSLQDVLRDKRARSRLAQELILEQRLVQFWHLICTPVLIAAVLGLTGLISRQNDECISWTAGTMIAAALELLGSYYVAGLVVAVAAWFEHGPFRGRTMLQLNILGVAGSAGSISIAVLVLSQRCSS
jgi:hypothetical protein